MIRIKNRNHLRQPLTLETSCSTQVLMIIRGAESTAAANDFSYMISSKEFRKYCGLHISHSFIRYGIIVPKEDVFMGRIFEAITNQLKSYREQQIQLSSLWPLASARRSRKLSKFKFIKALFEFAACISYLALMLSSVFDTQIQISVCGTYSTAKIQESSLQRVVVSGTYE